MLSASLFRAILSESNRIPTRGSSKKGSHVYFLLQVFWVILLFDINVVLMLPWWPDITIVQSDATIIVPWQLSTGSKHDYLFLLLPVVGILFEVLRITQVPGAPVRRNTVNLKLTWKKLSFFFFFFYNRFYYTCSQW